MSLNKTYYHGSPIKFKKFSTPNGGKDYGVGIYLTGNYHEATQYALGADDNGYIYEVTPRQYNVFDVTSENQAKAIIKHLKKTRSIKGDEFDFINSSSGFDSSSRYSWYHRIASMFNLNDRSGDDMWEVLSVFGFDAILDPVKDWLVLSSSVQTNIVSVKEIKINDYDFSGKPGEKSFIIKKV